jgi:dimethylhistidine N-methyltransferase/glutamate--cysteine ligase
VRPAWIDRAWEDAPDAADAARRRMRADVRAGLLDAAQKELPPTYFYDAVGSKLFDEITRLPEYYLTRAERRLLERHAPEIIRRTRPKALAELGSGTSSKTRVLLHALLADGGRVYVPIDVDADTLRASAAAVRAEFPALEVRPMVADMRDQVAVPYKTERPVLYAFLGSTIGNFDARDARTLLARVRAGLGACDSLLLGVDLIKDVATIEAAYNDRYGVTAEFNRNVLRVLNAELGATFDVDGFDHHAFYDQQQRRIEMHLVSRRAQHALVPGVGVVRFREGESIRTDISCKYDRQSVEELLGAAGWRLDAWLTDDAGLFALVIARPAMAAGVSTTSGPRAAARARTAELRDFVARHAFAPSSSTRPQRLGAEIEFIAITEATGEVAPLDAPDGMSILDAVRGASRRHGWIEGRSSKGAPWFRLPYGGRVTFEPGGQLEYASPPHCAASHLLEDLRATAAYLRDACGERGIRLLDCGLDPMNGPDGAPLQVRGERYRRMDAYFARIGPAGARMMRQTASLQVAVDIGVDAFGRWRLLNALAPVLTAVFANSRCYAGAATAFASYRAETWRRTDPSRTGVLPGVDPLGEYVDFALHAPAFLLGDEHAARPFETWVGGLDGTGEWDEHLGTLFPEVRPRGYFEIRSIDAIPATQWAAAISFVAGLAYDLRASCEAAEILNDPDSALLERAGRLGLSDPTLAGLARELAVVARRGCERLGPAFLSERDLGEATDFFGTLTR